jgi:tetratricopeptide (TPR) repeat protein
MFRKCFSIAMIGLFLGGCASSKKQMGQQAQAAKRWNDARTDVLVGLARDEYNNQNFDESRQTIDEAMKISPDISQAHLLSARLYIEQGQLEAAERELDIARQLEPANGQANAEADYLSGVIYQRWQQPARALVFYQSACNKAPAELSYLLANAEMLVLMNQTDAALDLLQAKVTYFEHSGTIRDEVGLLLIQQGHYGEAAEMLRRASILAPDEPTIREHLAMALYYDKQYSQAVDVLTPLLQDENFAKRADLWLTLGECKMNLQESDEAVHDFQLAAGQSPESADIWLSLAKAQMQDDNLRSAELSIRRSLSLQADNSQTQLLLGYLRLRQGQPRQALTAFERANALDPSDSVALCMIGYALEKLGRADLSGKYYAQALQIQPHDEMASQLMARLESHE